jgi:uncharacterized protein (DUF1810 family)
MADPLDRFVSAQAPVYAGVRAELRAGRKRTHWMWFVFPQLAGLGRSAAAQFYAIADADEARAYLGHPLLGPRLRECTSLVLAVEGSSAHDIFGAPDDLKFRSCMTLFAQVAPESSVFADALRKYFSGQPDTLTLGLLGA